MAGTTMQQRRGTAAVWSTANPILHLGEIGIATDTEVWKVGDGVSDWNSLPVAVDSVLFRGATNLATPGSLVKRDALGNISAGAVDLATPTAGSAATTAARKDYVDTGDHSYPLNYQSGTAYTPTLSDAGAVVRMNNAAAMTFTIPLNASVAYPIGTWIEVERTGSGTLTVAPASGVSLNAPDSDKTVRASNGRVRLLKTGTDTWYLSGGNNTATDQALTALGGRNAANGYVGLDSSSKVNIAGRINAPGKISIFNNGDVSLTMANDTAPLQIGINGDVQTIWDNNEMYSRAWNSTTGAYDLNTFGMSASAVVINANASGGADLRLSGTQGTRTDNATRKDYVDGLVADSGWTALTVTGGMAKNASAPLDASYRTLQNKSLCHLHMALTGNAAVNATIATVPSTVKPARTVYAVGVPFGNSKIAMTISAVNGAVQVMEAVTTGGLYLDVVWEVL